MIQVHPSGKVYSVKYDDGDYDLRLQEVFIRECESGSGGHRTEKHVQRTPSPRPSEQRQSTSAENQQTLVDRIYATEDEGLTEDDEKCPIRRFALECVLYERY